MKSTLAGATLLSLSLLMSGHVLAQEVGAEAAVSAYHLEPIVIEGSTAEVLAPEVSKEIGRHLVYPRTALLRRIQGVATVSLVLDQTRVINAGLKDSTGHAVLDEQALKASMKIDPARIFPTEYVGRAIEIVVPVAFVIR